MREKVGWDDSSNPEWAARNAVASGAEEPWGDAAERARWAEAATAAVRSLQGKARAMEAGWGSYAGGGPEDAAARQALRALLGWAGREREGECETPRRAAGAMKRLALAMVALRVRPAVREAGVEAALQHVARALLALAGAAQWGKGAHVQSGPRLARLAEKRLETLREALKVCAIVCFLKCGGSFSHCVRTRARRWRCCGTRTARGSPRVRRSKTQWRQRAQR